jgi:putative redox protein
VSTMTAVLRLQQSVCWKAEAGSGHSLIIDGPAEAGGQDAGFRPMELMLLGLGACMGLDMLFLLGRMRQEVTGYELRLTGERADDPPAVYTAVTLEHVITGRGIREDSVKHALELAETKYCSASAMFSKTARLTNRYRILEASASQSTHRPHDRP